MKTAVFKIHILECGGHGSLPTTSNSSSLPPSWQHISTNSNILAPFSIQKCMPFQPICFSKATPTPGSMDGSHWSNDNAPPLPPWLVYQPRLELTSTEGKILEWAHDYLNYWGVEEHSLRVFGKKVSSLLNEGSWKPACCIHQTSWSRDRKPAPAVAILSIMRFLKAWG